MIRCWKYSGTIWPKINPAKCWTPAEAIWWWIGNQGYCLTDGYKRDLTEQEEQDIERMGAEIAARCEEN